MNSDVGPILYIGCHRQQRDLYLLQITMLFILGTVLCLALGAQAQLNPLGRFGKCIDVSTVECAELKGLWYLQYRPDNPDHYVHTCQAEYEQKVKGVFHSLLYFYNKGVMVNAPQDIKYNPVGVGKYKRGITVDDMAVYVYLNVLHYDPVKKFRIVYMCTDHPKANPDIFNINISTEEQVPDNLDDVLSTSKKILSSISPKFGCPLMKVEQSLAKCKPLNVQKKVKKD